MKTKQQIEQQIENILVAKAMMDSLPDSAIYPWLYDWVNEAMLEHGPNHCGSTACFGGWVALHPFFKKQGVSSEHGVPVLYDGRCTQQREGGVAHHLFGDCTMFDVNDGHLNDRDEITRRLKRALDGRLNELSELDERGDEFGWKGDELIGGIRAN